MSDAAERLREMRIWNLPLNLAALEIIGNFDKTRIREMVGLRELD